MNYRAKMLRNVLFVYVFTVLIVAIISILVWGCKSEVVAPEGKKFEINGVWNSVYIPGYETKLILIHLTNNYGHIAGSGQMTEDKIIILVDEEHSIYTYPYVTLVMNLRYPQNNFYVDTKFMGKIEKDSVIVGHWDSPFFDKTYPLHLIPNTELKWLPKYSHNQGSIF